MTLSHETMLELMQYADGELDGDARARVEALLRTNEEARRVIEAMGVLGEVVREGIEDRAASSPLADGIAESVMAAIALGGAIGAGASGGAAVVPLARARRSRGGVAAAVVTVLALAAGVALFLTGKAPAPVATEDIVMGSAAPRGAVEAETAADETGVDLKEVRSIRNKVNVFFTPTAATPGASTSVVVWIDDRQEGQ
jgi:hypothetical protein